MLSAPSRTSADRVSAVVPWFDSSTARGSYPFGHGTQARVPPVAGRYSRGSLSRIAYWNARAARPSWAAWSLAALRRPWRSSRRTIKGLCAHRAGECWNCRRTTQALGLPRSRDSHPTASAGPGGGSGMGGRSGMGGTPHEGQQTVGCFCYSAAALGHVLPKIVSGAGASVFARAPRLFSLTTP